MPKTAPRRHRLLYVENDVDSVALVTRHIAGRKDLALLHAPDMDLAFKLAQRERPEVMLINLELADLAPAQLMKLLRANPATQTAPILALSANAAPDAVVRGLEAGFFLYLTRPLQAEPFMEALAYALEFAALERAEQPLLRESR
jgi:DNA-binding response OmpR family regulator